MASKNVGVAGQDAEEVPLMAVHVDSEEVVVLTVKDLSESKRTELVTALEICEGVKDVTLQNGGRVLVGGTAPLAELVGVAKGLGLEADGRVEKRVEATPAEAKTDPVEANLMVIKATALVCLALQNASQALCMKYSNEPSMKGSDGLRYLSTTAVVMGELCKLITSCVIISELPLALN